jgi:hypothetical protein
LRASPTFQELSQIIKALPQHERDDICQWLENDKYLRLEEEFNVALSQLSVDLGDFGDIGDVDLGEIGDVDLGDFAGGT